MSVYAEHKPTRFDRHISIEDREDWIVAPVTQTRDSGRLERSNFRVVLSDLGGESETVEVHRFGHWGSGWYEIIICAPDSPAASACVEWEESLADYPVASDEDYSTLEHEEISEQWGDDARTRGRIIKDYNRRYPEPHLACYRVSLFAARRDEIPDRVYEYLSNQD